MKKRLNLKALFIILAVVAAAGAGVHFLHAHQVRNNAGILLARAEKAEEEKRLKEAAGYLSRYVALQPGDTEARCKFALLLADKELVKGPRDLLRAFFALSRAVQLAPERDDVRRRLVDVAMEPVLQRYSDALDHLQHLPPAGELLGLRARCLEEMANYKEARDYYEKAIVAAPAELTSYLHLANLLRTKTAEVRKDKDGKKEENLEALADATIDAMVMANPKDYRAYLSRSRYLKGRPLAGEDKKTEEQIRKDVGKASQLAPNEIDVLLAVADLERDKQDPQSADVARKLLRQGLERHKEPEAWRLVQALAQIEMLDGKPRAALKCLSDGLERFPGQLDLLWNHANLLIEQNDAAAPKAIEGLRTAGLPRAEMDYLEARVLFQEKKWRRAAVQLERAYPMFLKGFDERRNWFALNLALECNFLLGNCYEQLGDPYRAASAYDRVVAREPRSVGGLLGLARMKWSLGQLEAADLRYRQAASQGNAPASAWVELGQVTMARTLQQPVENRNWKAVLDVIDLAEKRPEKQRPELVTLSLMRAEVAAARMEYDSARKVLRSALDGAADQPVDAWVGLAGVAALESGDAASALAILDEAAKKLGDRVELRIAKVRFIVRKGGPDAPKALVALGRDLDDTFKKPQQLRLLRALAAAYGQIADAKQAVRMWRRVVDLQEHEDLAARFTLFELALFLKDRATMDEQVDVIKQFEGEEEGSLWRYCRACQLIWQAEQAPKQARQDYLAEASRQLKIVGDRRTGWSRVPVAEGQVDDLQDRHEAAIANYKRALLLGENRPAVIQKLVLVFTLNKDFLTVDELTRKLEAQSPKLIEGLEQPKAVAMFFNGNREQALALARKAVPNNSKNYRDHIWLAGLLRAADPKLAPDAEASLRRAVALADRVPEPWVYLIKFLVGEGRKKDAETALKEAEAKLAQDRAQLELAVCHELVGDAERARALYEAALAERPEDAGVLYAMAAFCVRSKRLDDAKVYLSRILKLNNGTREDLGRAKRLMAALIASGGGNEKALEALALLDGDELSKAEATSESSLADQRARMAILASQPSARKRREAIALLEELRLKQAISLDERFLMARLHESVGEWPKARRQLAALLISLDERLEKTAPSDRPALRSAYAAYLSYYTLHLLRRGDTGEAKVWQAKLERLEPDSWRSLECKARVLAKQGENDKEKEANGKKAGEILRAAAATNPKLALAVAQALEDAGQFADAQKMLEKHIAEDTEPHRVLTLATYLARRDRPAEALDLCERAWSTCKPEAVASVSVAVIYLAKSGATHSGRVAARLEQAATAHPAKLDLLASLAAVRRLQGRADDAVKLLRQVTERDRSNSNVFNNIAWLLALENRPDEAMGFIKHAITLRGEEANLLDTRGVVFIVKGDYAHAIDDLQEALTESPTASRYFHLARAQLGAGNVPAARAALVRARDMGLTEMSVDPMERAAFHETLAKTQQR